MTTQQRLFLFFSLFILCVLLGYGYIFIRNYNFTPKVFSTSKDSSNKLTENKNTSENKLSATNLGFAHAFLAAISVIVVSELGDKTFFIAAIMAMKHSRLIVYSGAMGALGAMTVLSALLGNIVTTFVPRIYTFYLSSILFAGFGLKMFRDAYFMSNDEGTEEYKEVQEELEQAEAKNDSDLSAEPTILTTQQRLVTFIRLCFSPIFIQAFVLTFLAEWGDRSQITTIVLAASENLLGVIVGGTIGHGLCTGLAVIGGRFIAQRISPKNVTYVGAVVFLCFAASAIFIRPT